MAKQCIYCGAELHPEASFCHQCERSQIQKQQVKLQKYRSKKSILLSVFLLFILILPLLQINTEKDTVNAEATFFDNGPGMAEVHYSAEDGETYHIYASFSGDKEVMDYRQHAMAEDQGRDGSFPSMFFVRQDSSNEFVGEEFLQQFVDEVKVEAIPLNGAQPLELSEPEQEKLEFPTALRMTHVYIGSYNEGENIVRWTLKMKNGDLITLEQTVCIELIEVLEYHWEDVQIDTIQSLVDFMEYLERTLPEDQVIDLFLPPVTYEGGLQLNRSFRLHGSVDENGAVTTFTAPSIAQMDGPTRTELNNIAFVGNGGTGMTCHKTIFLEDCRFEGWDIAVHVKEDGWSQSDRCTYQNNGIGLLFDCKDGGSFGPEFDDNHFENNEIGIQIKGVNRPRQLRFKDCVFSDNEIDIDNQIEHDIDISRSTFE